jgi:hypothetical protein
MKWIELTPEQQIKVIDYNIDPECIREDAYEAADDYRDAVFMTFESLTDWWDNCDDEIQRGILGLDDEPPSAQRTA